MKLAEALKTIQAAPPDAPPLEVALLCGFTPLHLQTFLEAQLCKLFPGHSPRVQVGLFGDLMGNLRRVADVAVAVVVIEWADLDPRLGLRRLGGWEPSQLPDILDEVSTASERQRETFRLCCVSLHFRCPQFPSHRWRGRASSPWVFVA